LENSAGVLISSAAKQRKIWQLFAESERIKEKKIWKKVA